MKKKSFPLYEWLATSFIMVLVVSNIASVKLVSIGSIVFDAGTILFPISYIIGDIIAEVYGFKRMRGLLIKGIAMLLATSLTFWIVGLLPASADWAFQGSYDNILGVVWRIVFASIIAIFVGELMNAYVLAKLKIASKGKNLWGRLIGSSAVGSLVDTTLFSIIAFIGTMPLGVLFQLIVSVYLIKMAVEIIISPITIRLIAYIKKQEKTDVYEEPRLLPTK